jgi:DNA-directed RNA polymerase subunit RPC12/RpoP
MRSWETKVWAKCVICGQKTLTRVRYQDRTYVRCLDCAKEGRLP